MDKDVEKRIKQLERIFITGFFLIICITVIFALV